jgi:hypothetical protein
MFLDDRIIVVRHILNNQENGTETSNYRCVDMCYETGTLLRQQKFLAHCNNETYLFTENMSRIYNVINKITVRMLSEERYQY